MSASTKFVLSSFIYKLLITIIVLYNLFLVEVTIAPKVNYASDVYSPDGIARCETFVYNPDTNQLECPTMANSVNPTFGDIDSEILDLAPLFFITFVLAVFGLLLLFKFIFWLRSSWKTRRDSGIETYQQFECPEPVGINTVSGSYGGFTNLAYDGNVRSLSTPDVISIGTIPQYQDAPPPDYQSPPAYNQCVGDDGNDNNSNHPHNHNQSVSDRTRIIK